MPPSESIGDSSLCFLFLFSVFAPIGPSAGGGSSCLPGISHVGVPGLVRGLHASVTRPGCRPCSPIHHEKCDQVRRLNGTVLCPPSLLQPRVAALHGLKTPSSLLSWCLLPGVSLSSGVASLILRLQAPLPAASPYQLPCSAWGLVALLCPTDREL